LYIDTDTNRHQAEPDVKNVGHPAIEVPEMIDIKEENYQNDAIETMEQVQEEPLDEVDIADLQVADSKQSVEHSQNDIPEPINHQSERRPDSNKGDKIRKWLGIVVSALITFWKRVRRLLSKAAEAIFSLDIDKVRKVRALMQRYIFNPKGRAIIRKRLRDRIQNFRFGKAMDSLKLGAHRAKRQKRNRILIVIAGILALILIYFGYKQTQAISYQREVNSAFEELKPDLESLLRNADRDAIVNSSGAEEALVSFESSVGSFAYPLEDLSEEDQSSLDSLRNEAQSVADEIFRVEVIDSSSVEIMQDFRLESSKESKIVDIDIFTTSTGAQHIVAIDSGSKNVVKVNLFNEQLSSIENVDPFKDPRFLTIGNFGLYVFDAVDGVFFSEIVEDSFEPFVKLTALSTSDWDTSNPTDFIALTDNDNLYLLGDGELKRAINAGIGKYRFPESYLSGVEFDNATNISADSSLYISRKGEPSLSRLIWDPGVQSMVPVSMVIDTGSSYQPSEMTATYPGADNKTYLFGFDPDSKQIQKWEKPFTPENIHPDSIRLLTQYRYNGDEDFFNDVKDLVVNTSQSAIYVADGSRILKVNIDQ